MAKFLYIAHANIPGKYAHTIQIMKMVEAFNKYVKTDLLIPFFAYHNIYPKDIFEYYNIKTKFNIKRAYNIDFTFFGLYTQKIPYVIRVLYISNHIIFSIYALFYALLKKYRIIFTRDPYVAYLTSFFIPTIYETHLFPRKMYFTRVLKRRFFDRLLFSISITNKIKEIYKRFGFNVEKMFVFPDGVDEIIECNKKYKNKKPIITYIGSIKTLGNEKGIDLIIHAAKNVPNALFKIVGIKKEEEMRKIKNKIKGIKNIELHYFVDKKKVKEFLCEADILVIPYPYTEFLAYYTSPLKLFEYMSTGKCIVTSHLPTIREILNDNDAVFFAPGNKKDFVEKLRYALSHKKECEEKGKRCKEKVKNYLWDVRAKKIINIISKKYYKILMI